MTDLQRLIELHEAEADRHQRHGGEFAAIAQGLYELHVETARILRTLADVRRECKYTRGINLYGKPADIIEGPAESLRRLAELLGGGK